MGKTEGLINLGIEGRDKFGCDVATEFRIPNYQYDCTSSKVPECATSNLNFLKGGCLAPRTEKTDVLLFYSLADMVRERNLAGRHVSFKLDIEGAEWPGFRTFPVEDLQFVDQITMEVHLRGGNIDQLQVWGNIDTVRSLAKEFVSVSLHMTNFACVTPAELQQKTRFFPSFVLEVTLVNKRLITINKPTRSYANSPLLKPSWDAPDCQMTDL
jgi:hypothetical protein